MNCERVEQLLSQHLEGLVAEREVGAMEAHLGQCPACRRLQEELLALRSRLRALALQIPEAEVDRQAIDLWMAEREASNGRWRNWFRLGSTAMRVRRLFLGGAAAALFLVVLAFYWWGHARVAGPPPGLLAKNLHPTQSRHAFRPTAKTTEDTDGNPTFSLPPARPNEEREVRQSSVPHPSRGHLRIANGNRSQPSTYRPRDTVVDDLALLNRDPKETVQQWAPLAPDEWEQIEARVKQTIRVRDDFVQIPFPRLVSTAARQIAQAAESYKREAAIVDPRLSHEVSCAFKATALCDLCDQLRTETSIQLTAGPSVADEKVTVFCEKMPLRDVMRQLSWSFGYTWLRSRKEGGEYRYELVQDLKSQLLEEELRNRDRRSALLSLQDDIDRYRPYLRLSPDEALERLKMASAAEKPLLEKLSGVGWGPIQMYFRLSPQEQPALRSGQTLTFSQAPDPGELPLPADMARSVLQSFRYLRVHKSEDPRLPTIFLGGGAGEAAPGDLPLSQVPEVRSSIWLSLSQSELGQFTLDGGSRVFLPKAAGEGTTDNPYAVGRSPATLKPDNHAANLMLAAEPPLRVRVTLQPNPSCGVAHRAGPGAATRPPSETGEPEPEPKITAADALEALHRATGLPIVSDFYTRLYKPEVATVKDRPLFDVLDDLGDRMRLRWRKEGAWLQFRSVTFYDDRRKEVPNRLLSRWASSRRQHGTLTLDGLVEIAQLPDVQLDGTDMAEGARECWGLIEWDLVRNSNLRPHLRFLASFTPEQREEAMSTTGLPFTKMTLAQQKQFIEYVTLYDQLNFEELPTATIRVEYTEPGWFQWASPALSPHWMYYMVAVEPGRRGRWVTRPRVRERTREAALAAVRRLDPTILERALHTLKHPEPPVPLGAQVFPSELNLTFVYIPGASTAQPIHIIFRGGGNWQIPGL